MSANPLQDTKADESLSGLQQYLIRFVVVVALLLVAIPLLPGLIANVAYSFSGEAPKLYWYLSRSAGFVALTILWISMVLGLGITNKLARRWPGAPAAFAIHEFVSLLGLAFTLYHALVLMGDHFVDFSLPRLLTPFSIAWKPLWIGLGQMGFYLWLIVAASFYVRRSIGQKTWRLIHYVNFGSYLMALLHGLFTGTDSSVSWVRWYYLATAGSLLVLLVYRLREAAAKRDVSLAASLKQRAQDMYQAVASWKRRLLLTAKKRTLHLLVRGQELLSASVEEQTGTPDVAPSASLQAVSAPPPQAVLEEPSLQDPETPVVQDGSPSVVASALEAETTPAPAYVVRQEQGSEKSKINIRIFKEPPEKQVTPQARRDSRLRALDIDPLIMKLKRFFRATPIQPGEQEEKRNRVRILED